jgi:predicted dehydrogenase
MNVGVIGVGTQGERHVRVYSELKNVDSITIWDTDPVKMVEIAKKYDGVRISTSGDNLIRSVDALSICTPTKFHYAPVVSALGYDTPFLVEKPFNDTRAEAEMILDEYTRRHSMLTCGVGHIERFNPIVREINMLIRSPNIPKYIEIKRHNPSSARMSGVSNVIDDLMIHDIDILLNVFFRGCEYNIHAVGNEDVCACLFEIFAQDGTVVPAYLSASRKSAKKVRSIYIENEHWTVEGNYILQDVYVYRSPSKYEIIADRTYKQENVVDKIELGKVEPLREELKKFLECVSTGDPFPITLEDATHNVNVCELIKQEVNL